MGEEKLCDRMLDKSIEAFIMAVEIYNKPTIKYRVEGFAFFICNAWELILKAKLIKERGEDSIYYKDNKDRTISLENCIRMIFTNENDNLRKNIEKIIELRNMSTHFVVQEYEMIYVSLFQACVYNFCDKIFAFHGIDIFERMPSHFINLVTCDLYSNEDELRLKYSDRIYNRFVKMQDSIGKMIDTSKNHKFSVFIHTDVRLIKNKNDDVPGFRIVNSDEISNGNVAIIKEFKDPNNTHPYSASAVVGEVKKRLKRKGIDVKFTMSDFNNFNKYFDLKTRKEYCYENRTYSKPQFSYSQKTVDFIATEIIKDQDICRRIREKSKKPTPGARDSK